MQEINAKIELSFQIDAGTDFNILTKNHKKIICLNIENDLVATANIVHHGKWTKLYPKKEPVFACYKKRKYLCTPFEE
jgi:hypothetical protein